MPRTILLPLVTKDEAGPTVCPDCGARVRVQMVSPKCSALNEANITRHPQPQSAVCEDCKKKK